MKNLMFILISIPFFSYGQRFEVSEMAGYSQQTGIPNFTGGYCNNISGGYNFNKNLYLGVSYVFNNWSTKNNCFGLVAVANINHFYCGANIYNIDVNTLKVGNSNYLIISQKFAPGFSFGAFVGLRQKISKRMKLMQEIGINHANLSSTVSYDYATTNITPPSVPFNFTVNYLHAFIGLS